MNNQKITIFDIATAYNDKNESNAVVPGSSVLISTNRYYYGNKSTLSKFIATAYDKHGNTINSMNGYFLEPHVEHDSATIENSKKAILGGRYQVIPKQYETQKYSWYLKDVKGRKGIAIHIGNHGTDSKGCILPGTSYSYDRDNNESPSSPTHTDIFDTASLTESAPPRTLIHSQPARETYVGGRPKGITRLQRTFSL